MGSIKVTTPVKIVGWAVFCCYFLLTLYGLNNIVKGIAPIVNPARLKIMKRRNRGWRTSLLAFSGGLG